MKYNQVIEAEFIRRPNRFVSYCNINGVEEKVHVPNTGRCKELLVEGAKVILSKADKASKRKTKYSLVSVYKGNRLINIDSQSPNSIVEEALKNRTIFRDYNFTKIKREQKYGNSRFDIYYEREDGEKTIKGFIEVKGVTLELDNLCLFPDAPTERGLKHILELVKAHEEGYETNIIFLIQMDNVDKFAPNYEMHPEFAKTLAKCQKKGVNIHAFSCKVTPDTVVLSKAVEIIDLNVFL